MCRRRPSTAISPLPYQASKQVAAAWLSVYHNSVKEWDLYELAERLVDLDYKFQLWRFAHVKTVERIIGHKRGTGGTGGVSYLDEGAGAQIFSGTLDHQNLDVGRPVTNMQDQLQNVNVASSELLGDAGGGQDGGCR